MNELIEYVRVSKGPQKGNLRGVVLATKDGVGWSFTRTKKHWNGFRYCTEDRFNKQRGLDIARARAVMATGAIVPRDVEPVLERMKARRLEWLSGNRTPVAV